MQAPCCEFGSSNTSQTEHFDWNSNPSIPVVSISHEVWKFMSQVVTCPGMFLQNLSREASPVFTAVLEKFLRLHHLGLGGLNSGAIEGKTPGENTTREIWINKKTCSWNLMDFTSISGKKRKDQFNRMVIGGNQWLPKYYKHDTHTLCSISSPHPSEDPTCKDSLTWKPPLGWLQKGRKGRYHLPRLMIHPMSKDKSYPPKTHDCCSMKRILSYEALVYASKKKRWPSNKSSCFTMVSRQLFGLLVCHWTISCFLPSTVIKSF